MELNEEGYDSQMKTESPCREKHGLSHSSPAAEIAINPFQNVKKDTFIKNGTSY